MTRFLGARHWACSPGVVRASTAIESTSEPPKSCICLPAIADAWLCSAGRVAPCAALLTPDAVLALPPSSLALARHAQQLPGPPQWLAARDVLQLGSLGDALGDALYAAGVQADALVQQQLVGAPRLSA